MYEGSQSGNPSFRESESVKQAMRRHHQQIRTIDHEPLPTDLKKGSAASGRNLARLDENTPENSRRKSAFSGSTRKTGAITGDFFTPRPSDGRSWSSGAPMSIRDLSTSVPLTRTIAAVVSVFTLAITIPTGFIAMTESMEQTAIDPVTTASINTTAGSGQLAVSDVSMTRIMKSGSTVVTIFGEIRNTAGVSQTPGDVTIQLQDENGHVVQSWQHRTGAGSIKPDGKLRFMTSSIDASGRARSVVAFTKPLPQPGSTPQ